MRGLADLLGRPNVPQERVPRYMDAIPEYDGSGGKAYRQIARVCVPQIAETRDRCGPFRRRIFRRRHAWNVGHRAGPGNPTPLWPTAGGSYERI